MHTGVGVPRDPRLDFAPHSIHPLKGRRWTGMLAIDLYNPPVKLTCPACTAPELIAGGDRTFGCTYCGTHFIAERTECPACGELNEHGADLCSNCGEPLSIVASVIDRQGGTGRPLWIRRLQTQVAGLKESEARASADRFEGLMEIDRKRKTEEAAAHASQQQKDRSILFYGVAAILLIVLIVLVLAVIL